MLSSLTKTGLVAVVGILLLIAASAYFYFAKPVHTPSTSTETPLPAPPPAGEGPLQPPKKEETQKPTANEVLVEMLPDKFSPQTLAITVGTTVRFVNKDKVDRWPASGFHPTHQVCPGFDAKQSIKPGGSYRFTFTEAKQCPMHDHLNPAIRGVIVVNSK